MTEEEKVRGGWFSTSNLKLAVALHAAGFPFREQECTRVVYNGRESFTWHFRDTNHEGRSIAEFVGVWEREAPASQGRPDGMTCFYLAREIMYARTHIIAESHKFPVQKLLNRGDARLMVSERLSREDREALARLAS